MFTDFTYNNIGLPKNLNLPWYYENTPDQFEFYERISAQFRVEIFNLFNQPESVFTSLRNPYSHSPSSDRSLSGTSSPPDVRRHAGEIPLPIAVNI
jgi:hypothetical protein